jgi:hypothetical protein
MTSRRTETGAAVAVLERTNPVDQERLAGQLDVAAARARIGELIAADTAVQHRNGTASAGIGTGTGLAARWPMKALLTTAAVAAVVGVIVVALDSGTPAVQSASAKTISGVLRALTPPAGSILHIDVMTTEITPGHRTYVWEQEVYEQTAPPYRSRTIDERLPGTPAGTEGVIGMGTAEQTYDPINNTIYDPILPKAKPVPGAQTPTPAQEAQLFQPYMAQYVRRLRAKLASGAARVAGRSSVDGRAAIKIEFAGSDEIDYVAADGSYVPIKTVQGARSSPSGQTTSVFRTFEFLPMAGNASLLRLRSQHPSAKIDRRLADFRRADKRLFRNG